VRKAPHGVPDPLRDSDPRVLKLGQKLPINLKRLVPFARYFGEVRPNESTFNRAGRRSSRFRGIRPKVSLPGFIRRYR